jgi:glutamyl-tRNA synthetase
LLKPAAREPLVKLQDTLAAVSPWEPDTLHQVVKDVAETLELKLGKVAQPLRVAVAGRAASPGIDVTLYLVGREACLRRIDKALEYIAQRSNEVER